MKSISKSECKALSCPAFWHAYYCDGVQKSPASWTRTGTEFHAFASAYVDYLVSRGISSDLDWVEPYLAAAAYCDDAADLVRRYVPDFDIDPQEVFDTELFWAIDGSFRPVRAEFPGVGKAPAGDILAHGTLDRVDIVERSGLIVDYKTGFMPSRIDPYEAAHYGILAFAHLPQIEELTFRWDFVRMGYTREQHMTRGQLPELQSELLKRRALRDRLAQQGGPFSCDPLAGLCGYCGLQCPVRAQAAKGEAIIGPLQSDEDAASAAGFLAAIRAATATVEEQLKAYLADRGAVDLGDGREARLETTATVKIPLRVALSVMGVQVPESTPAFQVPLDKLTINSTQMKQYGKAKKRAGLLEQIEAVSEHAPRTVLRIGDAVASEE